MSLIRYTVVTDKRNHFRVNRITLKSQCYDSLKLLIRYTIVMNVNPLITKLLQLKESLQGVMNESMVRGDLTLPGDSFHLVSTLSGMCEFSDRLSHGLFQVTESPVRVESPLRIDLVRNDA